ncbi:cation diffusion facilitator family transporter, partial [bacterium]|nr:cation diffusion facilitator family transporter [bacterium]
LINLTILVIISLYLLYEAIWRFFDPVSISGWVIVIVAGVALVIDMITALITLRLSKNNMNMKAAFLHNLSDALASLAVIVAGSLIILYQWFWVDTLLTLLLSLFILYQGLAMLPKTIHLLMDGAPEDIDFDAINKSLLSLEGVDDIHHVHVWSLDEETIALEAHVVANIETFDEMESIKNIIKKKLSDEFNIKHSTLEFEHEMMC